MTTLCKPPTPETSAFRQIRLLGTELLTEVAASGMPLGRPELDVAVLVQHLTATSATATVVEAHQLACEAITLDLAKYGTVREEIVQVVNGLKDILISFRGLKRVPIAPDPDTGRVHQALRYATD